MNDETNFSQSSDLHGQIASGVVTNVKSNAIHVSFEDSFDELLTTLSDDALYNIIKLANDVTYKRLRIVLDRIKDGSRFSALHNALFGVGSLSSPHQTLPPQLLDKEGSIVYENNNLNQSQREAINFALLQRELAVIHGPPGTGKTTTIVEYISQEVKSGHKVLACAPSNVAVDNLLKKLTVVPKTSKRLKVVRLGHPARVQSLLQKHSLDALISNCDQTQLVQDVKLDIEKALAKMKKSRGGKGFAPLRNELKLLKKELRERETKAIKHILTSADVVLATLTSAAPWDGPLKHLQDDHFDVTVIDECSQSLEMACWIPMLQAKKVILAGDHMQLPPTIMSTEAACKGLEFTLMERVIKCQEEAEGNDGGNDVVRMLSIQYRMNAEIMNWSSNTFYESKLIAADAVNNHLLYELDGVKKDENTEIPLLLIDTTGCEMNELETSDEISKANEGEVGLVMLHVQTLIESGVDPSEIAVITPYNLQVELIRLQLHPQYPQLEVRSVDGFQGREKEAVVISLVRSNSKKEIGFLSETRRLNVAVTRARRHVAVICDVETVSGDPKIKGLTDYMQKNGEVRSGMQYQAQLAHQGNIVRPEGMELILKDACSTVKKEKKTKAKGKANKGKEGKQEKQDHTYKEAPSDKGSVIQNKKTEDEIVTRQNELKQIMQTFLKNDSILEYNFPPELNSHDRLLIHEIAEHYNLSHESVGEGKSRYLSLKKRHCNTMQDNKKSEFMLQPKIKEFDADDNRERDNDKSQSDMKGAKIDSDTSIPKTKSALDNVTCSGCGKEMPRQNIELHKVRCQRSSTSKTIKETSSQASKKTKSQKKEARLKDEDDIDKLLDNFNKLDTICNGNKVWFRNCTTKLP